ncbi:leucine rich repeat variant [Hydrogenimonas sp.]|nr:leucine rich repeat variant [Hydrogenimonas sp.]
MRVFISVLTTTTLFATIISVPITQPDLPVQISVPIPYESAIYIMERESSIEELKNRDLPLTRVKEIFEAFTDDMEVVGQVAMNLSMRTSVYDKDMGRDPLMVELLVRLSETEDMGSRWAVAKNPHTPSHILQKLAEDKINLVRALAATNPNTPSDVLQRLFNDEKIVRDGLSGNPSVPPKILAVLADDSDKMVRMRVAENPSTPKEVLEKLTGDGDENVAKAAEVNLKRRGET